MQFYIALEDLLLPEQASTTAIEPQVQAYNALRTCLLELYRAILDFQIKSIVRFYKDHWFKDIYGSNDWKSMRSTIQQLETSIRQDSVTVASNDSRLQLQRLLENAETAQAALLDIQEKQLEAIERIGTRAAEQVNMQTKILQQANDERAFQSARQQQEVEAKCLQLFRLETLYETTRARTPRHVEGTCQWFLTQPTYIDWLTSPGRCLLVSADPGCGKSVLSRNLVDNELPKHNPDAQICYFFFKQGIQDSLDVAIPALLHQLLYNNDQCFKHVLPFYEKEGQNLVANVELMLQILRSILLDLGLVEDVIIVLDALDECVTTDRERFLTWLREFLDASSSAKNRHRFLLTCRPYDEIVSFYEYDASASQVHIPGNAESETISQEVNLVIKYRAEQLYQRSRIKKAVQDELEQKLLAQKNRTYLWVFVVFNELERKIGNQTLKDVHRILQSLPATIYDAYEQILNRYTEDEEIRAKVSRILHVMLAARRSLSVQEIQCAVKLQLTPRTEAHDDLDLEDEDDFALKLRNWCGLFIQIHDSRVNFLHKTARDFLLSQNFQLQNETIQPHRWGGVTYRTQAHRVMTGICLAYLLLDDFDRPTGLHPYALSWFEDESATTSSLESDTDVFGRYPFLAYASRNWDHHFEDGTCSVHEELVENTLSLLDPSKESYQTWRYASKRFHEYAQPYSLCTAAAMNSASLVQIILQRSVPSPPMSVGRLAWRIAIDYHKRANALVLVKYGMNDEDAYAMDVVVLKDWKDVVQKLCEQGLDSNSNSGGWAIAMTTSIGYNKTDIFEILLQHGANLDMTDNYGVSPLLYAVIYQRKDYIIRLIEKGADPNLVSGHGRTILHYALQLVESDRETQYEIVKILCESGMSVDIVDDDDKLPMKYALRQNDLRMIKALLDAGAGPNTEMEYRRQPPPDIFKVEGEDNDYALAYDLTASIAEEDRPQADFECGPGCGALHLAASHGDISLTQQLLERGAHINTQNTHGGTALAMAAKNGHIQIVRLLLEHDADATIEDADCGTAWTYAMIRGHEDIAKLLPARIPSRRFSLSDLWPCKPLWDRNKNGYNSTFKINERRLYKYRE